MEIPENIKSIIEQLKESEDEWKARYMAYWGFSYKLEDCYKNTIQWNKELGFGLPAFKRGHHAYSPEKLYRILRTSDRKITYEHLIMLWSLFEAFVKEIIELLSIDDCFSNKGVKYKHFFKSEPMKEILKDEEIDELYLVKESRNCYIHGSKKAGPKWVEYYETARNKEPPIAEEELLDNAFDEQKPFLQIERWHDFILEIVNKIENKIRETKI